MYADQAFQVCKRLNVSADWLLDESVDDPVPEEYSHYLSRIMEIVHAMGAERAWRRLAGIDSPGTEPRLIPPPDHQVTKEESA